MQHYSISRDSIASHHHVPSQEAIQIQRSLRTAHNQSSNQLNNGGPSISNSILQDYKNYSKNFFSRQSQNHHMAQAQSIQQPQIIHGT